MITELRTAVGDRVARPLVSTKGLNGHTLKSLCNWHSSKSRILDNACRSPCDSCGEKWKVYTDRSEARIVARMSSWTADNRGIWMKSWNPSHLSSTDGHFCCNSGLGSVYIGCLGWKTLSLQLSSLQPNKDKSHVECLQIKKIR